MLTDHKEESHPGKSGQFENVTWRATTVGFGARTHTLSMRCPVEEGVGQDEEEEEEEVRQEKMKGDRGGEEETGGWSHTKKILKEDSVGTRKL